MSEEEEFESYNRILDIEAEHLDTAEELEAKRLDLSLLAEQLGPLTGHAEDIHTFGTDHEMASAPTVGTPGELRFEDSIHDEGMI
jgi:hypothetical protein